ncbi:response regulator receiver domain-containing protein [Kineococcus xinjiangensis]|uniref:Response regulator receiver domain-containing protein n=1 Tax=Kineococcus xinjiangensis TaxID=512762 RepID=A0A2S6IJ14_9ACTN|nr:response regulator [Kineococcus xinjiangensis]PPK94176.1 response regulator receiver domain-containing protein [Kineococcus xinjiangensis]
MARVLVVEDDQDIRTLLEVRLRAAGHRVVGAGSGEEALAIVADRGAPEVLVSDVSMPGLTGLELLEQLRRHHSFERVPVVFLSGRVQPEDIAAGQALGATYLTKPVVLSALCAAIDRGLNVQASAAGSW